MPQRHRLEVRCPDGNPSKTTIHLDGEQLLFVSRVELVLDASTGEAAVQLTIPAVALDLDVDAAVFVTAHTPQSEADPERLTATTAPCTASFRDVRGAVRACNQAAGHYDETREPVWPTPLGPPTRGGLHTDGESIWHDRADGATPHEDESE